MSPGILRPQSFLRRRFARLASALKLWARTKMWKISAAISIGRNSITHQSRKADKCQKLAAAFIIEPSAYRQRASYNYISLELNVNERM